MVSDEEKNAPGEDAVLPEESAPGAAGKVGGDGESQRSEGLALEESLEPAGDVEGLRAQLEQARGEAEEAREQVLRAVAEAQNTRRRAEKDVTSARQFALERFVKDLVPVLDNLERALGSVAEEDGEADPMREGVELTLKSLNDVLKRFGVEPVDPLGEPFDPRFHEAISMLANPAAEPNSVLEVVQKGYTLNGRLVRAAMVVVSS